MILLGILAAGAAAVVVVTARQPGPTRLGLLIRRYGPAVILLPFGVAVWVAGFAAAVHGSLAGYAILVAPCLAAIAANLAGYYPRPGWIGRTARRIWWRCAWPSIARSAGLAVKDERPAWGRPSATRDRRPVVEWLPAIRGGRVVAGGAGLVWQVRAARGQTVADLAAAAQALEAAGGWADLEILDRGRGRGTLTGWLRPAFNRPIPAGLLLTEPGAALAELDALETLDTKEVA
ncbi:MAG: hypothetical protein ACKVWR_12360 [Acidimicrobiales bacterium]